MSRSTPSGASKSPQANTNIKAGLQSIMNMESIAATRRKASSIPIPDLDDDAMERKRVLNVLAQRRYRKRKREYLRKLEASIVSHDDGDDDAEEIAPASTYDLTNSDGPSRRTSTDVGLISPPATLTSSPDDGSALQDVEESTVDPSQLSEPAITDFALDQSFDLSMTSTGMDWFDNGESDALNTTSLCPTEIHNMNAGPPNMFWASTMNTENDTEIDAIDAIISSTSSTIPRSTKLTPFQSLALSPQTYPHSPSIPYTSHLAILELDILRAATTIASCLSVSHLVFDLTATSPFAAPSSCPPPLPASLPLNLQPTLLQTTTPHHPIIDVLPWPSVRNRLIAVFSLPPQHRPPIASSPTALLEFVYDIEDGAEGVRIHGSDPLDDKNWEVGEQVLKNWWWAFDRQVLGRSNVLRRRRGAGTLSGGGSVMGEV